MHNYGQLFIEQGMTNLNAVIVLVTTLALGPC